MNITPKAFPVKRNIWDMFYGNASGRRRLELRVYDAFEAFGHGSADACSGHWSCHVLVTRAAIVNCMRNGTGKNTVWHKAAAILHWRDGTARN